jgi:molybdopterin-synthase adenylyltransferase
VNERYSRNEALFGKDGQLRIAGTRVAIVGLGGLGSHVAQQAAHLGVTSYVLVDVDLVTESSLNRLVGAIGEDAINAVPKVEVAKRLISQLHQDADAVGIAARLEADGPCVALKTCDVIFGCVDNDLARLHLTEIASRCRIPYIDLASDTGGDRDDLWYGGRVVFAHGSGCLSCLGLLDQQEIRTLQMSAAEGEVEGRLYGVRNDALEGTGPAVISVNGVVASLAVTEFMVWRAGIRQPALELTYRGDLGSVRRSTDAPAQSCFYCDCWLKREPAA